MNETGEGNRPSFWQRRIVAPLVAQLTQGVTPDKLAFTLGVGTACSLFPFLGLTSLLNLGVGIALKMNQPILQTLNQLLGPLQLLLILVYVQLGEWIWLADADRFTVSEIISIFRDEPLHVFLKRFGWAGIHALTAWLVSVPLIVAATTFPLRPVLRRLARRSLKNNSSPNAA